MQLERKIWEPWEVCPLPTWSWRSSLHEAVYGSRRSPRRGNLERPKDASWIHRADEMSGGP